ncbi:hypothetical protein STEG23_038123, partial [Scotinomys teguina]
MPQELLQLGEPQELLQLIEPQELLQLIEPQELLQLIEPQELLQLIEPQELLQLGEPQELLIEPQLGEPQELLQLIEPQELLQLIEPQELLQLIEPQELLQLIEPQELLQLGEPQELLQLIEAGIPKSKEAQKVTVVLIFSGRQVWNSPTHRQLLVRSFSKEQEDSTPLQCRTELHIVFRAMIPRLCRMLNRSVNNFLMTGPKCPFNIQERRYMASTGKAYLVYSSSVAAGAQSGIEECKYQFAWDRWNCPERALQLSSHGGLRS